MIVLGNVWQSKRDTLWLAEISALDLMVQARRKKEIAAMIKDAVELLVDDSEFTVKATQVDDFVFVDANDEQLIALMGKR